MQKLSIFLLLVISQLSTIAQPRIAEGYYVSAFNEISDMLAGRDSLSIKRATFLAEWAYYEGDLNYDTDFCDEIDRIVNFIDLFYDVNNFRDYKTGKQMALNEYFFRPYSGNQYNPYIYDFESFSIDNKGSWDCQFVSKVLKSHKGQCRSLPWMYKILAQEIGANVSIALAPGHCYIVYKDEDNLIPEDWVNLELTTHQMQPAWWIKQNYDICDSAVIVGTYMNPLTDTQTVACQLADLAFGYKEKFQRYDEFTFYCANRSLEFYPMNPNAWIICLKSFEQIMTDYLLRNNYMYDEYVDYLIMLMEQAKQHLDHTHMTMATEDFLEHRRQQAVEAQKYTQENILPK